MCKRLMLSVLIVVVVCAVGSVSAVVDLKVDIGTDQLHDVEPGWTEWAEPSEDPGPVRADETFGDIHVILTREGGEGLAFRDPDAVWPDGYDGPPLIGDGVMIDNMQNTTDMGVIHMSIGGLSAGDYTMTTWHNYVFDWTSEFVDVEVDGQLVVDDMTPTVTVATTEEAATATFDFTAPGDANVVITFRAEQPQRNVPLNGFHLVSHSQAREPDPADEYLDACPDVVLSWTAGEFAQPVNGHDVYFGTDYDDVNDATTTVTLGVYKGRQSETEYDPPGLLDWGNTYYWRIDEVNDAGAESPLKGNVWTFTVNDKDNYDPDPADGADQVPVDSILSWSTCVAGEHKVYFSTDFNDVNNRQPSAYKGQQSETTWDPCGMEYLTDYYWAVDKIDGPNFWPGQVRSFKTESAIVDPNMILWYEFNETEGEDVPDSSGYERHGVGDDFDGDTWDPNDGRYPGCINFDGGERIDVPWSTLNNVDDGITISVWVKGAMGDENYLVSAGDDGNNVWLLIPTVDLQDVEWRAGNDTNDTLLWREADPSAWTDEWHHLGLLKDEIADKMEIYFDGVKVKSKTGTSRALGTVGNKWFKIACRWDEGDGFNGRVDDFRVYDYALARVDIEALFRGGDLGTAWAPSPSHGQTDVLREVVLTWRPGNYADSHDVYFGTDWDDVNDADTTSGVYIDNREPNEYDPDGSLEFGTTYYWRVDEVNDPCVWKGKVWKFTVANYIIIDDFESYDTDTYRIYDVWCDGACNTTGSIIELGSEPWYPARGGDQSMQYIYYNDTNWGRGYFSEAELPFWDLDGPQDFTDGDVKVLTLYFYGHPDNDVSEPAEGLYVGLGGSYAEVRYADVGDLNDLLREEWTEWNIPVSDFDSPDPVDPCNIDSLFIGFGARGHGTTAGSGIVHFDDIRLYPPRCVPQYGPAYDFSGNCIVDWADVRMIGDEWLRRDAQLAVSAPGAGPVGFWKLDDGDGVVAWDDSGNFHDGTIEDSYSWITGRIGPAALEFTGDGGRILVPDHAQLRPTTKVSASAWAYFSVSQGHSARILVKGADNNETYALETNGNDAGFYVRDTNGNNFNVNSDDIWPDEWTHLAGTFDGDTNTVILYLNGREVDSRDDADFVSQGGKTLSQDTNDLAVGNRSDATDREFIGRVDDVRVYDYALSAAEVAYIATEGTGYFGLESEVNIYDEEPQGSKAINIKDLAVLLDYWLVEKLWPE